MGREHDPAVVFRAQELYCADHLTMEQVREALAAELGDDVPAMSTLWRWSNKYDWFTKRDEIAKALAAIKADTVLARAKMLRQVVDTGDPQCAFGAASLESLALKQAEAVRAGLVVEAQLEAAGQLREITTQEDAAAALQEALNWKLSTMLADKRSFDIKDIKHVREGLDLLAAYSSKDKGKKSKGLTRQTANDIREKILGVK